MLLGYHIHQRTDPWEDAPPWAIELRELLRIIMREGRIEMAQQQDIAAALAKVQSDVASQTSVTASVAAFIQGLQKQLADAAANTTDNETADQLNALSQQIEANSSQISSAIVQNTPAAATVQPAQPGSQQSGQPAPGQGPSGPLTGQT
jgi:hypothetical protein